MMLYRNKRDTSSNTTLYFLHIAILCLFDERAKRGKKKSHQKGGARKGWYLKNGMFCPLSNAFAFLFFFPFYVMKKNSPSASRMAYAHVNGMLCAPYVSFYRVAKGEHALGQRLGSLHVLKRHVHTHGKKKNPSCSVAHARET